MTPYPNGLAQVSMFALGTFGAITVGIWRGLIYDLSPAAWIVAALSGGLGIALTALAGRGSEREKVDAGVIIAAAFLLEIFPDATALAPTLRSLSSCLERARSWLQAGESHER
jgi:hypothetical protein